jgi:hypothetical protein
LELIERRLKKKGAFSVSFLLLLAVETTKHQPGPLPSAKRAAAHHKHKNVAHKSYSLCEIHEGGKQNHLYGLLYPTRMHSRLAVRRTTHKYTWRGRKSKKKKKKA